MVIWQGGKISKEAKCRETVGNLPLTEIWHREKVSRLALTCGKSLVFGTLVAAGFGLNIFNLELMTWVIVKASGQD